MRPDSETLRRLYIDERQTTRQIANTFATNKSAVVRWLVAYGIPRRASGHGLANRGVDPPTAAELNRLINVEYLGCRGAAKRYGVDPSSILQWCRKLGVPVQTTWGTRRAGFLPNWPADEVLAARYLSGERIDDIAADIGVSRPLVTKHLLNLGVEIRRDGYDGGKRFACADGHNVRSTYERRVCDWLHERAIPHTYEPRLPWDQRSRADFMANGWYIEIWGVQNSPAYAAQRARKQAGYRSHGVALVEINHFDFSSQKRGRWRRLLAVTSNPAAHALPLLRT